MMTETEKRYEKASDLTEEERMLVQLRDELYFRNWERMRKDLKGKLKQRPYIYKLHNRIEGDLKRMDKLEQYELRTKTNLADLLKEEQVSQS